jgi:hypothetical protein
VTEEANSNDEVRVVYTAADLRSLYAACRRCKRNAVVAVIGVPAFFVLLSFKDGARGTDLVFAAIPYFLLIPAVMFATYFLLPFNTTRLRRKNGWEQPMVVRLTDQGISTHHPNQESLFYWSKIQDVVVRGGRLYLFTTPSCAIILPRRCFSDEAAFGKWAERARKLWREATSVAVE